MEKKIVVARIQILGDKINDYLEIVAPLVEATRAEEGNLAYLLYQSLENPAEFIIYEEYINEDAFKVHLGSPLMNELAGQIQSVLAKDINVQVF